MVSDGTSGKRVPSALLSRRMNDVRSFCGSTKYQKYRVVGETNNGKQLEIDHVSHQICKYMDSQKKRGMR